jgi:hypothetical protein
MEPSPRPDDRQRLADVVPIARASTSRTRTNGVGDVGVDGVDPASSVTRDRATPTPPGRPLTPTEYYEYAARVEELEQRSGRRMRRWIVSKCKAAFRDYRLRWLELHAESVAEGIRDPLAFFVDAIVNDDYLTEPLWSAKQRRSKGDDSGKYAAYDR